VKNRTLAATLTALVLLMSHIAGAQALTNGWNFIRAGSCSGGVAYGVNYVFVYPTTGGALATADSVTITLLAPLCTSGDGFFVYLNGTNWTGISIYPSIR
jgi:hypothetical protein